MQFNCINMLMYIIMHTIKSNTLGIALCSFNLYDFFELQNELKLFDTCFSIHAPETRDKNDLESFVSDDEFFKTFIGLYKKKDKLLRVRNFFLQTNNLNIFHASFKMNLATNNTEVRKNSIQVLMKQMKISSLLGIKYLTIHPGTTKNEISYEEGIKIFKSNIEYVLERVPEVCILVENMCNNNGQIFSTKQQIQDLLPWIESNPRLGICWDTAHATSAGFEQNEMIEFMKTLKHKIVQIHMNNVKKDYKLNIDRHEMIFFGFLPLEFFYKISVEFPEIPKVAETPCETNKERFEEIVKLKKYFELVSCEKTV